MPIDALVLQLTGRFTTDRFEFSIIKLTVLFCLCILVNNGDKSLWPTLIEDHGYSVQFYETELATLNVFKLEMIRQTALRLTHVQRMDESIV